MRRVLLSGDAPRGRGRSPRRLRRGGAKPQPPPLRRPQQGPRQRQGDARHRGGEDEHGQLLVPLRRAGLTARGRVVRVPDPQEVLQRHDLPPDRPRLRDPGRRPDRQQATAAPAIRPSTRCRAKTTYLHGTVAMAKTQTDPSGTAGSQFFVVTEANAELPPIYAVHRARRLGPRRRRQDRHVRQRAAGADEAHRRSEHRPSSLDRSGRPGGRRVDPLRRPKQWELLPAVLERVALCELDQVVVVEGAHPLSLDEVTRRPLPRLGRGPGASLRCGLAALDDDGDARGHRAGRRARARPSRRRARDRAPRRCRDPRRELRRRSQPSRRCSPRSIWGAIPDEGARALDPVLVDCSDLEPPGDVDVPRAES